MNALLIVDKSQFISDREIQYFLMQYNEKMFATITWTRSTTF